MKIAITGANSRVGQTLIDHLLRDSEIEVIAGARSLAALVNLPESSRIHPVAIAYDKVEPLAAALKGATCLVHLAGILMEGKGSTYRSANVDATRSVVRAARQAGVNHVVFISVVGAHPDSANPYFRSKGEAEMLVAQCGISSTIIRTPMLLGPGAAGAAAISGVASRPRAKLLGGGNYTMRPLDIDDLCVAILNVCRQQPQGTRTHELVGPEPKKYSEIIRQAAALLGNPIQIGSVPIWAVRLGAQVRSLFSSGGITPAVLDVITMNEEVSHNADQDLGVSLTPLATTLSKFLKSPKS